MQMTLNTHTHTHVRAVLPTPAAHALEVCCVFQPRMQEEIQSHRETLPHQNTPQLFSRGVPPALSP